MYFGYSAPDTNTPSSSQNDQFIATQSMVWIIEADLFNTNEGDSAAKKLCDSAPDADAAYKYYKKLKSDMLLSFEAARPSFASQTKSGANTYVLKWNESKSRFEYTFTDENKVLSNFDFDVSGFSITKNGNTMTVYTDKVNTTGATGTFTSNIGQVDTTTGCVYWLTGKEGYQEFVSEQPQADPITAYIKVKTENIGYGSYKEDIHYFVVETKAAAGYILDDTKHDVVFKSDGKNKDSIVYTLDLTNKPDKPDLPQTGDDFNPWIFAGIGLSSIALGMFLFIRKRKEGKSEV